MHELRRYGRNRDALTLCLAAPEHRKLSGEELDSTDRDLGTKGRIVCLDDDGDEIGDILRSKPAAPDPLEDCLVRPQPS